VYTEPTNDVDDFNRQLEKSVIGVLDVLAPLQSRTKRRGKPSSRCLSAAAIAAKRKRRQLGRRWKKTKSEEDRVAYRVACQAANGEINASRSEFYVSRLAEMKGNQLAQWRVAKELLCTDDRPPDPGLEEAKQLCDGISSFCYLKLKKIADDIRTCC